MPDSTSALINMLQNPGAQTTSMLQGVNAIRGFQAQQAQADALQQATDPTTGAVDVGRYNALVAGGKGAWTGAQAMGTLGTSVGAQGNAATAQAEAARAQDRLLWAGSQGLRARAAAGEAISPDEFNNTIANISGVTPQTIARAKQMSAQPNFNATDAINGWAAAQAGPEGVWPYERLSANVIAGIKEHLSNASTWTDPKTGQVYSATEAARMVQQGADPGWLFTLQPGGAAAAAPGAPVGAPASASSTGRAPVTQTAPGVAPAAAPPAGSPWGTAQPQLPPEQVKASQDRYLSDLNEKGDLGKNLAPTRQAMSVLRANPDMGVAGTATKSQIIENLAGLGIPIGDLKTANNYQEIVKDLQQNWQRVPGATRSDKAAVDAAAASANEQQGHDVIMRLLAKQMGMARMNAARADYWVQQHGGDKTAAQGASGIYLPQTADWAERQDPVALATKDLNPEDLKAYIRGLTPEDYSRYAKSRAEIVKLYGPSGQPGG